MYFDKYLDKNKKCWNCGKETQFAIIKDNQRKVPFCEHCAKVICIDIKCVWKENKLS